MLTLIHWLSRRRLSTLHSWGAMLGWLAYALAPAYRRRLDENAGLAALSAATRRRSVAEAGRMVAELPWLWLRPPARPLADLVQWQGEGLIDDALAQGRGLVLLTPHLGCFEVCAQAIAERIVRALEIGLGRQSTPTASNPATDNSNDKRTTANQGSRNRSTTNRTAQAR